MKKLIAMIMLLALLLTAVPTAAATQTQTLEGKFCVGYGKAKITPPDSVPLAGYGKSDQRMSKNVLSDLWATCIAVTDDTGNTILLYGLDLVNSLESYAWYGADVSAATGVPLSNIIFSASHTHSAPDFSYHQIPGIATAKVALRDGLVAAGKAAMEDRSPAQMACATVETEGLNFVRHYICNDGSYAGDNFGNPASGYAGHATDADPMLQLVKFTREGGKDIILSNFQCHPHQTGGGSKYDISADVVGAYRDALSAAADCEVIYFSGAGGNINSKSRIASENKTSSYTAWGKALADYAQTAVYTPVATGRVQADELQFTAQINHTYDSYASLCSSLYSRWSSNQLTTAQLIAEAKTHGLTLNSPYHANAIAKRANMSATAAFPIRTFSFGQVGFVGAPYEMFDTNGMYIKEKSPFQITIVATIANKTNGYFPSAQAFAYGCYEADTSYYAPGSAERLADYFVQMLNDQYTTEMHRLYNPNSGEHHYTALTEERDFLVSLGWKYEGVGWLAPTASDYPVYRLYNPHSGDHHYTMLAAERDFLIPLGWVYEGIGWYSEDPEAGTPLHRLYNPHLKVGSHHYSLLEAEVDFLLPLGWKYENIGWYGVKPD